MNNIAHYRRIRGLSQYDLAEMVGVKQPHISRLEGGSPQADGVTLRLYKAIAYALGVEIQDLFNAAMSKDELAIIEAYRSSPDGQRRLMMALALEAKSIAEPTHQSTTAAENQSNSK